MILTFLNFSLFLGFSKATLFHVVVNSFGVVVHKKAVTKWMIHDKKLCSFDVDVVSILESGSFRLMVKFRIFFGKKAHTKSLLIFGRCVTCNWKRQTKITRECKARKWMSRKYPHSLYYAFVPFRNFDFTSNIHARLAMSLKDQFDKVVVNTKAISELQIVKHMQYMHLGNAKINWLHCRKKTCLAFSASFHFNVSPETVTYMCRCHILTFASILRILGQNLRWQILIKP